MTHEEAAIVSNVIRTMLEERMGERQLKLMQLMSFAIMWSEETEKIAIVFANLITEITHRDNVWHGADKRPPQWLRLLPAPPKAKEVGCMSDADWKKMIKDTTDLGGIYAVLKRERESRVRSFYAKIEPWGA